MQTISPRIVLALGLLAGLASACGQKARTDPQPEKAQTKDANAVSSQAIADAPGQPIEKILANRVAGVRVTRTADGGIAVQIRGTSTFSGDNAPLYVIDGMPINPGPGGSLQGVNPYDIEKIEVLKDAAATAIYGTRGANGVIVIKMKKP